MKQTLSSIFILLITIAAISSPGLTQEDEKLPGATINGTAEGFVELGKDDFVNVNCYDDTWTWKDDGLLHCTGKPVGVMRTKKVYTNFELVVQWKHLKSAGNSGVFVWSPIEALTGMEPNSLPNSGIEVQILDHGYTEQYEKDGRVGDWFSTNGDVFPVGKAKLNPFPPLSPNGKRSFPSKNLSNGFGNWNHYYVRCINGEVRLWVNGEEVSGGNNAEPRTGHLCLESEGSPIVFKNIRIRELP